MLVGTSSHEVSSGRGLAIRHHGGIDDKFRCRLKCREERSQNTKVVWIRLLESVSLLSQALNQHHDITRKALVATTSHEHGLERCVYFREQSKLSLPSSSGDQVSAQVGLLQPIGPSNGSELLESPRMTCLLVDGVRWPKVDHTSHLFFHCSF